MAIPPVYILVRIWIHSGLETEFEAYETQSVAHHGALWRHH